MTGKIDYFCGSHHQTGGIYILKFKKFCYTIKKSYKMKIMQKYFFLLLFSLFALHVVAQDIPLMEAADDAWRFQELKDGRSFISPKAIAGNPYLEKNFKTGKIISKVHLKFPDLPLRYNVYTDNIEYKGPDGKVYALKDHNKVSAYQIGDTTFVYLPYYKKKNEIGSGYFQLLVPGNVSALVRYSVYLLPATPERPYQKAKPERFSEISKTYYVKIGDEPAQAVNKTKEFIRLFPAYGKQLTKYIKQHKIRLQKQEDFIRLVKYYQSLTGKKG